MERTTLKLVGVFQSHHNLDQIWWERIPEQCYSYKSRSAKYWNNINTNYNHIGGEEFVFIEIKGKIYTIKISINPIIIVSVNYTYCLHNLNDNFNASRRTVIITTKQ